VTSGARHALKLTDPTGLSDSRFFFRLQGMVTVSKALWLRLIIPLILFAGVFVYLEGVGSFNGLFLNLATEFIGIIVTVAYVDWVIKAHERKVWQGTTTRIAYRLQTFSSATVTGLRSALGFGPGVLDQSILRCGDAKLASAEVMRVATHVVAPALRTRLDSLDVQGWKRLAAHVQETEHEAERLLQQFGHLLAPEYVELLLDMRRELDASLTFWRTFPDIAGVPDSDLPKTSTDPVALKAAWTDITAAALRKALQLASSISTRCNA